VLLSNLGKLTVKTNELTSGLYRTGVSFRVRGESRQYVMGGEDHDAKPRALVHRKQVVAFWVAEGWEVRTMEVNKEDKWSLAHARSAPTPENWGPRFVSTWAAAAKPLDSPTPSTVQNSKAPMSSVPSSGQAPSPTTTPVHRPPVEARGVAEGNWDQLDSLVRQAVGCRECFERQKVPSSFITVAQPRWVPPGYFRLPFRVAVLMINPGESRDTPGARLFLDRMAKYRQGALDLRTFLGFQRSTMMAWGNPPGRFAGIYFSGLGLNLDEVAFANVAWCGTIGNRPCPAAMLNRCFKRHTGPLLRLLQPTVVLASGNPVHQQVERIRAVLPETIIAKMSHYAYLMKPADRLAELDRVRQILADSRVLALGSTVAE
jgi:uracil-DNA glycosylase